MKYLKLAVIVVAILAVASGAAASPLSYVPTDKMQSAAPPAQAKQLVIYMQMGGTQGIPRRWHGPTARRPPQRTLGSSWSSSTRLDSQKMIDQFKQAVAAKPDGIVIMGHPGEDAFAALVDDAESQGIIVTSATTHSETRGQVPDQGVRVCRRRPPQRGLSDRHSNGRGWTEEGGQGLVYDIWHQEAEARAPRVSTMH